MTIYSLVILPFVFGLVGFVEPCSMGINAIFLSSIEKKNKADRAKEVTIFVFGRAFVLALIGVSAAFVGNKYFSFQQYFFIILASLYIFVGILMIFSKSLVGKLRNIRIASLLGLDFKKGSLKRFGFFAGLTIPACAIPLITVLLGQSLLLGKILEGFVTLFIFGLDLSIPLVFFSCLKRGVIWIGWLAERANKFRIAGGLLLIIIGSATFYSSTYWNLTKLSNMP